MLNFFKRKKPKLQPKLEPKLDAKYIVQERQIDTLRGQIKLLEAKITLLTRLNEINSEKPKSKKLTVGRDLKTGKFIKINQ